MPSRQFLIAQSIHDAALHCYPASVVIEGVPGALRANRWQWEGWSDDVCSYFIQVVRQEYRRLIQIHGERK